jgi:hypothetical protein
MGVQEFLFGLGVVLLLIVLVYGAVRAGRRRQSQASKAATSQMYNDNRNV